MQLESRRLLSPGAVGALLVALSAAPVLGQQAPNVSATRKRLPISVAECRSRTDGAFRSEGYAPGNAGSDFAFGTKPPYSAEFQCLPATDGNTWAVLFIAANVRLSAEDRDRLFRALEFPNQAPAANAGGMRQACGFSVSSNVYDKWQQMGGQNGMFGCATSDEKDPMRSPAGSTASIVWFEKLNAKMYHFTAGRYAGQAFEVHGPIENKYMAINGPSSWLGFPISDEVNAPQGRRSNFEGGYVIWNASTGVTSTYRNNP